MKVAVVGGGIAGLTTAYEAQKHGLSVTLIDTRLGGKIMTDTSDGFVIEGGPDSFITQKPWGTALCQELGLELISTNDDRRKIYILRRGKLHEMPDGLMMVVPTQFWPFIRSPLISWRGKLRMGMDLFIKPRPLNGDESLAHFIQRRLGQEALDILAEPMMAGIYVADAETLSLQATFPRFMELEQKYGSLTRGMIAAGKHRPSTKSSLFMTVKGGLQGLVDALERALTGQLLLGRQVKSIDRQGETYWLTCDDGTTLDADVVVLATPAYVSAELVKPFSIELASLLNNIRYVSTATVSLGYQRREVNHPLDGFGFVIPRTEPTRLLACTWTSTKFNHRAPEDSVLLRAFIGGTHHQELVQHPDDKLVEIVREEYRQIMGIAATPSIARVFRWHRANPQYDVGHLERVGRMESLCPPRLYLTGSAYRGVGLPDCIHQGQKTVEKILQFVKTHEGFRHESTPIGGVV
ncbi:MAG: protoporphyrinogen oxidase [Anaerolineae bacterium]|nr:MAG: protoporphyrinogen oxidase [Anaerolineae bacterium]